METIYVEAKGAKIPAIGLGTWELRGRPCARIVEQALRLGYRHVDTAEMYGNEREVGDGLRASGVARGDVFLTTKLWPDHLAPRELEAATKASLARLRMSELDLLLIHWPNPRIQLAETVGALCRMKQAGFTRHIGVSNFTAALLDEAVRLATEPLVNHQNRMASLHRPVEGSGGEPPARALGHRLQPDRPRPRRRRRYAG
jgi:2,5-diketo-D-gluconate reductase B